MSLQEAREAAGISTAELAERSTVPQQLIEAHESDALSLGLYIEGCLSAALGGTPAEVFPRQYAGASRETGLASEGR